MGTAGNAILVTGGGAGIKANGKAALFDTGGGGCECCNADPCGCADSYNPSYNDSFSTLDSGWTAAANTAQSVASGQLELTLAPAQTGTTYETYRDAISPSTTPGGFYYEFAIGTLLAAPGGAANWEVKASNGPGGTSIFDLVFGFRAFGATPTYSVFLRVNSSGTSLGTASISSLTAGDICRLEVTFDTATCTFDGSTNNATAVVKHNTTTKISGVNVDSYVGATPGGTFCGGRYRLFGSTNAGGTPTYRFDSMDIGFL